MAEGDFSPINDKFKNTPDSTRPPTGNGTRLNTGRVEGSRGLATRPSSRFGREQKSPEGPPPDEAVVQELAETKQKVFGILDALLAVTQEPKISRDGIFRLPELVDVLDKKIAELIDVGVLSHRKPDPPKIRKSEKILSAETGKIATLERTIAVQRLALTRKFFGQHSECSGLCGECCGRISAVVNPAATEFAASWEPEPKLPANEYHAFFRGLMIKHT